MERFQNIRTIISLLITSLVLTFSSCTPTEEEKTFKQLSSLVSQDTVQAYKNIVVIMPIRCQGCVEDKLIGFINAATYEEKDAVLFVYDTSSANLKQYNAYLNHKKHIPVKTIDKIFPENANMYIYKIDAVKESAKAKILNPDDSSILYHMKYQ